MGVNVNVCIITECVCITGIIDNWILFKNDALPKWNNWIAGKFQYN